MKTFKEHLTESKNTPEYHQKQASKHWSEIAINGYDSSHASKFEHHNKEHYKLTGKHVDLTRVAKKYDYPLDRVEKKHGGTL